MKCKSLIAMLSVSTILAACGGGGGGGNVPVTSLPSNPGTPVTPPAQQQLNQNHNKEVSSINTVLVNDNAQVELTNQITATAGLEDVYAGVPTKGKMMLKSKAKASGNNICKSVNDCNQQLFNNMIKVLVNMDIENASLSEIKKALLLAGFTQQDLAGHIDDLKAAQNWIRDNLDKINPKVDSVLGKYAGTTLENAKFSMVTLHRDGQNSYVNLTLDDNKKIDGIEFEMNKDMAGELNYKSERNGNGNTFKTTDQKIYRYGINSRFYTGTYIDSLTELTLEEQREKLHKRVDELAATGAYDSDESNPRDQNVALIKEAIDKALGFNENSSLEVSTYEGDVREVGSESDKFEYCHMTYTKDETTTYTSYAKEMNLAYSDFGTLSKESTFYKLVLEGVAEETTVFAGGYEDKKIAVTSLNEDMTFSGRAVGAVNVVYGENGGSEDKSKAPLPLDGAATLKFDATKKDQTLTASFDNWYDVKAVSAVDGSSNTLTLDNWKSDTADDYKFRGQDTYNVADFTTAKQLAADPDIAKEATSSEHSDPSFGAFNIGYYGNDNMPTEATGYLYYEEARGYNKAGLSKDEFAAENTGMTPERFDDNYYNIVKNMSVNIGFGAVKQ